MKRIALFIFLVLPLAMMQSPAYGVPDLRILKDFLFQGDKTKIKKEELPESAQKTLGGDAFKGWSIVSVYKTKEGEYEVELKKGDTTQAVKFDKEGKVK